MEDSLFSLGELQCEYDGEPVVNTAQVVITGIPPCSRPCSLEDQYFKCGIFWDYDTAQRHASNSEAPVLAGGVSVFLRGTQFSGASELKEGLVSK